MANGYIRRQQAPFLEKLLCLVRRLEETGRGGLCAEPLERLVSRAVLRDAILNPVGISLRTAGEHRHLAAAGEVEGP